MRKVKRNKYQQIKDYYPIVNPHRTEDVTNVSIPSEEDIAEAKRWVDETQK